MKEKSTIITYRHRYAHIHTHKNPTETQNQKPKNIPKRNKVKEKYGQTKHYEKQNLQKCC